MKKNSHLTLGGLFVALHLLFIFLSKLLVGSELIMVIFLPLLSTVYSLNFDKKQVTMFFVATFLLCVMFEPISTFIYVLPGLICGTLYGVLRKRKIKELSLIYISSLSHAFSLLIAFLSISIMFKEVDFFSIFSNFIRKEGIEFYASIYLILMLLGVLESFVTHIITNSELKKLGYQELDSEVSVPLWMNIMLIISIIAYTILAIINPIYSCYAFPFLLAFIVPNIVEFIIRGKNKWVYGISGILLLVVMFVVRYVDKVLYPILLIVILLPLIVENFTRVLYTNSSKYLNNGENRIE